MKACLLAAGRGKRLGKETPKVLLELGGRTLLQWHGLRLLEAGIEEILLVTGYRREMLAAALGSLPLPARTVSNPRFEEGSVLSLLAALPELEGEREPVLLMDADVLYPAAMLERLLRSEHGTVLLVDRAWQADDDDPVLVPLRGGLPADFTKGWTGEADAVGESIGFFKVAPRDLLALGEAARRLDPGAPYEDAIRELVLEGRFRHEDVTGLPWIEIDFPEDLERARRDVLPLIGT